MKKIVIQPNEPISPSEREHLLKTIGEWNQFGGVLCLPPGYRWEVVDGSVEVKVELADDVSA